MSGAGREAIDFVQTIRPGGAKTHVHAPEAYHTDRRAFRGERGRRGQSRWGDGFFDGIRERKGAFEFDPATWWGDLRVEKKGDWKSERRK